MTNRHQTVIVATKVSKHWCIWLTWNSKEIDW